MYVCMYIHLQIQQKRASDPITDGCEPSCGCWELNSGPLLSLSLLTPAQRLIDWLIYYMWVHCCCLQTDQKRALDPITDVCEPPCGCWDLNSGPLKEQSVLLTPEPSLQPGHLLFHCSTIFNVFMYKCSVCMYGCMPEEEGIRSHYR